MRGTNWRRGDRSRPATGTRRKVGYSVCGQARTAWCNLGLLNFTIAHEIGHFILHKQIYETSSEKIALLHKRQIKNYEEALKRIEYQANLFASELLMPKTLFKEEWRKLKGTNYFDKQRTLCEFFGVLKSALEVRLKYLKLS